MSQLSHGFYFLLISIVAESVHASLKLISSEHVVSFHRSYASPASAACRKWVEGFWIRVDKDNFLSQYDYISLVLIFNRGLIQPWLLLPSPAYGDRIHARLFRCS